MVKMTHYATRYSDAFTKFVNAPKTLLRLWTVNSRVKKLQRRQRVTLSRVVRLMLASMTSDNNQIGVCLKEEFSSFTYTHLIETKYVEMYGETITSGRWYRAVEQLVNAGYLKTKKQTYFDNETQTIKSNASLKWFTDLFFADLNLEHKKDIRVSRAKMTADRIKKGLSSLWVGYKNFSNMRKKPLESILTEPASYDEVPTSFDDAIFI